MTTGNELADFVTSLNGDAELDDTLLGVLVNNARAILEEERPWMVLRRTDTSKTVTTGNTWQTAIDLSTITDFSRFYGDFPIRLFDGVNGVEYFQRKPTDRRLEYKDVSHTFIFDDRTKQLYINGSIPFSGTLYINYVSTSSDVDVTSDSAQWSVFPERFYPILGYYAIGINKGAIDYDSINREMLPVNADVLDALKKAMEKWDDALQESSIELNDPTERYAYPRPNAIDRYDS